LSLECAVVVTAAVAAAGSSLLFRGSQVPILVATLGGTPSHCTNVPTTS
jgi:hypothetical protein